MFLKQGCHAISLFFTILPITIAESRLLDAPEHTSLRLFFWKSEDFRKCGSAEDGKPLRQVQSGERLVSVQR